MISIFRFLASESTEPGWKLVLPMILTSIINGGLIALVVHTAETPAEGDRWLVELALFLTLFASLIVTRIYSYRATGNMLVDIVHGVQRRLVARIERTELLEYEALGHQRIYTALSKDTASLSEAAVEISRLMSSAVIVVCALVYIAWLSLSAFVLVLGLLGASSAWFLQRQRKVFVGMHRARVKEQAYYGLIGELLGGFAQLRMDPALRTELVTTQIGGASKEVAELEKANEAELSNLRVFISAAFYVILGLIIYVWADFVGATPSLVGRVVSIVQFITGPITQVVGSLSAFGRAGAAIYSITQLEAQLQGAAPPPVAETTAPAPFRHLQAAEVRFRYPSQGDEPGFGVEADAFDLRRGEIVFLIGGNGSGKSTFLKTICGLYPHQTGLLSINDVLASEDPEHHRSFFSIIFQDFHLFARVYDTATVDVARVNRWLERLGIAHRTSVTPEGEITNLSLSVGQRKRLALALAIEHQRDVLVLDEWAADQDPDFRRIFYREILPELRAAGRSIIAATHDDHYFDIADRIYVLQEGRLRQLSADERRVYTAARPPSEPA